MKSVTFHSCQVNMSLARLAHTKGRFTNNNAWPRDFTVTLSPIERLLKPVVSRSKFFCRMGYSQPLIVSGCESNETTLKTVFAGTSNVNVWRLTFLIQERLSASTIFL